MTPEREAEFLARLDALASSIARLHHRIDALERPQSPPPPPPPPPRLDFAQPLPPPIPELEPEPIPEPEPLPEPEPEPEPQPALESTFGLTWLNRIGVVTLILGVAFLFKYAVDNDWIGPAGRVALGILAGFATLAAGEWTFRRAQRVFAQGATALGISILYLSFYAAYGFYQLTAIQVSFVAMALTTALAGMLAIRYNALAIAVLAELGGFLTPIVLSTGHDAPWILFPYLLLISAGAVWLGRRQSWPLPPIIAFAASSFLYAVWFLEKFNLDKRAPAAFFPLALYALFSLSPSSALRYAAQLAAPLAMGFVFRSSSDPQPALFLALLLGLAAAGLALRQPLPTLAGFWLGYAAWLRPQHVHDYFGLQMAALSVFFLMMLAWILHRILNCGDTAGRPHLVSLAGNAVAYYAAGYVLLQPDHFGWAGLFTVAVAASFAFSAWLLRNKGELQAALVSVVIAISFLTLAAPVQLSAWRITLAWVVEGAALAFIAKRLNSERTSWLAALVLALVAARLIGIDSLAPAEATLFNPRFFVFAFAAAGFCFAASCHKRGPLAAALYIAGHLSLLTGLELENVSHVWRTFDPADAPSYALVGASVIAAAYGLALVALGVILRAKHDRLMGLATLAAVVAKLYLYDVWMLGRLFRTVAFVALGVLLVSASYLYSRYRSRLASFLE